MINAQLVGIGDAGTPVFATNIEPLFEVIGSGTSDTLTENIFSLYGDIPSTTTMCASFAAEI